MLVNRPVKDIMTSQVISISSDASLEEAESVFRSHKLRHLPVTDQGKLVGIMSLTDLQRMSFAGSIGPDESNADSAIFEMMNVGNIMQTKPVSIESKASVRDVAEILSQREFHALPVIEEDQLVGIVTTTDLIRFLLQNI
jgi:CBS domain-containing membrane protein